MTDPRKPVCLVLGAGAGIGGTVGARFALEGYHSVLCRRSDSQGLEATLDDIRKQGFEASGHLVNAVEEDSIEEVIANTEADTGPIEVVVYNLGAQVGNRSLEETSYKTFELGWRMATLGLFRVATHACPRMATRGKGTIIVTSATAAMRGNAGQHSHAAAMAGRRMLCQTLGAELGPKGVHVVHVLIDGAVDAPDTLGKLLGPERYAELRKTRGMEHEGLMLPSAIAETYLHLARQPRSTWTNEIDLRSFSDSPWWND